jgi:peptide/nickel transport system substrate-binding protein
MFSTRWARSCLVGLAASGWLAIAGWGGGAAGATRGGGVLRIGIAGTAVDSLNPFDAQTSLSFLTYRVVYPYLAQYNDANTLVLDWAKSYKVSDGGKTLTFTVPAGDKWSDGQPLTASDAAWTINTLVKFVSGPTANLSALAIDLAGADASSPTTVAVHLDRPAGAASILNALANLPILPRHVWRQYATGSGAGLKRYQNVNPVGAGPFLISKYTRNQFILFARNKQYYGTPPKLAGFGVNFYSNTDAVVNAIENSGIDVALDIPATTIQALKRQPSVHVLSEPSYDTILLGINSNPARKVNRELLNPTVREAISLAINRKQIVNTLTLGTGGVTASILPSNHPNSDDGSMGPPAYDPAKARQLLDGLGFKRGSNGIRIANGHPMSYTLLFGNTTTGAPLDVNLIVSNLAAIGIKAKALEFDPNAYSAAVYAGHYTKFDFTVDDYGPDFNPTHYLGLPSCGQFGAENESGYCNKHYDALYNLQTRQSGAARQATLDKMQQLILHDKPLIPVYTSSNIVAVRSNVVGFKPTPITIVNSESKQWIDELSMK